MTRSKRLEPVQQVTGEREREAARSLGVSRQRLAEQERKLAELVAYRDEYARQFQDAGGGGLPAARLQGYRVFLERLNQAIRQQDQAVVQAREAVARHERHWRERRVKADALGRVVERYRAEETREAERREQRDNDERARQMGQRRDPEDH